VAETLAVFRDPASVAVVGASDDPGKWGYWLARGALRGQQRRSVALVNRRASDVQGWRTVASLGDCDIPPELVVLSVPGDAVAPVVDQALALGSTGFLAVNGAIPGDQRLAERIRAAGARLIGPNSLGLFDAGTELQLAWGDFQAGSLAVVSQSGQLGTEICALAARSGLGVSRFVSIGNQLDVTGTELLADLVDHDATRVVALYLETFAGADSLFPVLRALRDAGKPVLLVAVGGSRAGQRAAASHTGAVTTPLDAVDALCRAAGALRVTTPSHLVDVACLLAAPHQVRSRRVAVLGDSGGQGAVAADVLSGAGLELPELTPGLRAAMAHELPPAAATQNPVDLAGAGEQDLASYARLVRLVAASGEVDTVVLTGYFGRYGLDAPALTPRELEVADELVRAADITPLLVHTMGEEGPAARRLREAGVPAYGSIDQVARALAAAATLAEQAPRDIAPAVSLPELPLHQHWDLRTLLSSAGVPFPAGRPVRSATEATLAARDLRAPLVLKAAWLPHKTEHGGVVLDLGQDMVAAAFRAMRDRLGEGEYLLEEQDTRAGVVEVLVGARRIPGVGPVVVVGAGGVRAELMPDVALELAPVTPAQGRDLLARLRLWPLLTGWRGGRAADVDGLAEVVAVVSATLAGRPDIAELELNPVRVGFDGVLAVDALVHLASSAPGSAATANSATPNGENRTTETRSA
jgi:acyl-CoA synthetase (NDP forming)